MDPEPAPSLEASIAWRDAEKLTGTVLEAARPLLADLTNKTDRAVTGRLILTAAGLDGRVVQRPLETFSLEAGAKRDVAIAVERLPIQSEGSLSFAAIIAEIDRPKKPVRTTTAPLYYRFQNGYREAVVYNVHEAGQLDNGGLVAQDPMNVQGRIIEEDGRITDAAEVVARTAEEAKAKGEAVRGLAGFGRVPADPKNKPVPPMAKSGAMDQSKAKALVAPVTSNVEVCSNWWVQYTDGGYGEDYFATDWWAHQQAKYAYAQIWDTSWNFYWDGNLTRTGCTYVSLPPGTYYLFEYSAYAASDTLSFNSYYWTSSGWATYAYESFDVYSNTNWVNVYPWGNDDATQVAAINGLVMDQDGMLANSLGLTAHWPYDVRTNWYCSSCGGGSHAYFQPPTSSAPNGYVGVGNHGVGGGDTEPHWKFMVTHELGHYAQFISMGLHDYSYSVSTNYDALCTCDHYDATLGNTLHCMQSYEDIGGAELEGFAHGFASRVYNYPYDWNASFTYYKPFLDDWSTFWFAPVAFDSFTSAQWLENHCVDSAAGVEMDWMAFYYSVTTELFSGSLTMQDLFSIYRRTCTGDPGVVCAGQTVYWWDLDWAAYVHYGYNAMDPHYLHFADTGYYAGVAH